MADMDHQPQDDLSGQRAVEKLRDIAKRANVAMFATQLDRHPFDVRPMATQDVGDDGTLYFLSSSESDKNRDIEHDPRVSLMYADGSSYGYVHVAGHATIHKDPATIDQHWTPLANAWFDGKDDPRVTVIAVKPTSAYYWDTSSGKLVTGVKMLLSAMGAPVDDGGVQGRLSV